MSRQTTVQYTTYLFTWATALTDLFKATDVQLLAQMFEAHTHETPAKGLQVPAGGLATNAVTTIKVNDLAITTAKINDLAVTTGKLAAGGVTMAKVAQQARCRIRATGNQSISDSTVTKINFDTSDFDTDTMADLANEKIICKTAGVYLITGSVRWAANATGYRAISVQINGANVEIGANVPTVGAGATTDMHGAWFYPLAVNDEITLTGLQTSGGNLNSSFGTGTPVLSAVWIGAT